MFGRERFFVFRHSDNALVAVTCSVAFPALATKQSFHLSSEQVALAKKIKESYELPSVVQTLAVSEPVRDARRIRRRVGRRAAANRGLGGEGQAKFLSDGDMTSERVIEFCGRVKTGRERQFERSRTWWGGRKTDQRQRP
jgi:hypothetical protein